MWETLAYAAGYVVMLLAVAWWRRLANGKHAAEVAKFTGWLESLSTAADLRKAALRAVGDTDGAGELRVLLRSVRDHMTAMGGKELADAWDRWLHDHGYNMSPILRRVVTDG